MTERSILNNIGTIVDLGCKIYLFVVIINFIISIYVLYILCIYRVIESILKFQIDIYFVFRLIYILTFTYINYLVIFVPIDSFNYKHDYTQKALNSPSVLQFEKDRRDRIDSILKEQQKENVENQ